MTALALPLSAAAAQAQDPHITDWHRCVAAGSKLLDDGRSDARSIAGAVVANCRTVRIAAALDAMHARGLSADNEKDLIGAEVDKARSQDIDYVSAIVLRRRAGGR